ncbi:hypothetical protein HY502_00650 [Candidatus Woesebacteria bacterium]|nr:hypothetical protein [Candidatus Woesebacteria bacterium]
MPGEKLFDIRKAIKNLTVIVPSELSKLPDNLNPFTRDARLERALRMRTDVIPDIEVPGEPEVLDKDYPPLFDFDPFDTEIKDPSPKPELKPDNSPDETEINQKK